MHLKRKKIIIIQEAQLQKEKSVSVTEPEMRNDAITGRNIHSGDATIPLIKTQVTCKFLQAQTKKREKSPADIFIISSDDT